jgi:hypothetical protein
MDIANLNLRKAANSGATLMLTHPVTGEDLTPITVVGMDSDVYQATCYEIIQARQNGIEPKRGTKEFDDELRKKIASLVTDWRDLKINGQSPADNYETLRDYQWIAEQVFVWAVNRANFLPSA